MTWWRLKWDVLPHAVSGELMEIVEIRELDGPNLFMLTPAIKLELAVVEDELPQVSTLADAFVAGEALPAAVTLESTDVSRVKILLAETVNRLHDRCGVERPNEIVRDMEMPGHVVVAYAWERRSFAVALGRLAIDIVLGQADATAIEERISQLRDKLGAPADEHDAPEYIRRDACRVPIVAITGTNGKTTTTRLISSILMTAGRRVGWTSSSGVYIQGEERVHGDYTGPSGAASVLGDPTVEVAVLETARGGILLRGIGYEANDVSVVTNISA
ncbi:MAG TPA: Mur ligase family protein, partial [Thermomicrobiales bacterium]|nr:Mur ligase family protein [Thermomicrobiales bacterium]